MCVPVYRWHEKFVDTVGRRVMDGGGVPKFR